MGDKLANDWLVPLSAEFKKPYYASLYKKVVEEYTTHVVYPPSDEIFTAFNLTPLSKVKVCNLGQVRIMSQVRHMVCLSL